LAQVASFRGRAPLLVSDAVDFGSLKTSLCSEQALSMMAEGAEEEDPFAEFLSQDQGAGISPTYAAQNHAEASYETGADAALRVMAASAQRQEQLLGKVCALLVGLDEKVGRIAANQERLERTLENLASTRGAVAAVPSADSAPRGSVQRGNLMAPPGKPSGQSGYAAGGYAASGGAPSGPSPEEQRMAAERMNADRLRMEEENRRRAEELARKRDEDERRKREEEDRRRQEEDRRREEERLRKEALEKKTSGLMSGLLSGSGGGGGGLFGDDEPKKPAKGGLFDD